LSAHGGTSEGESVCVVSRGYFYRRPREIRFVRESVRGPFTTEGVLDRSQRTLLTGRAGGDPDLRVKAKRPATARVVS